MGIKRECSNYIETHFMWQYANICFPRTTNVMSGNGLGEKICFIWAREDYLSAKSGQSRTNNDGCLVFMRIKLLRKIHLLFLLSHSLTRTRRAAIQFGLLLLDVCFLALNRQNIFIAISLQVLWTKCIYSNATNNFLFSSIRNRRRRCCVVIFIMSLLL